ncbi:hypothetical protein [Nocardia phage P3.1]|nr:hypothetical protein [Nocardia phage P3.1]
MAYYRKRSRPLAKQGWRPDFSVNQNPPQQPWKPWGDSTPADIIGGDLYIGDSGSFWNLGPRGGWGTEFSPLTGNWGMEFGLDLNTTTFLSSRSFTMYIGKNWVHGGDPTAVKYQVALKWEQYTTGSGEDEETHYGMSLWLDDKDSLIDSPRKVVYEFNNLTELTSFHTWRFKFINDNTVVMWMDGIVRWVYTIPASLEGGGFLRGPGLRSVAMRAFFFEATITNPASGPMFYDYVLPPPVWSSDVFYDNFNRANGAPANGWTTVGSDVVVNNNSLGLAGGFLSDGSRGAWRSGNPLTTGNMRLSVTLGGAHGVASAQASSVIGRMNAAGNVGIALNIFSNKLYIAKFSGSLSSPTFVDYGMDDVTVNNGDILDFIINGDEAWVELSGQVLLYVDGINAHSPESNRYYGARFNRGAFVNSCAFNDYRVKVKV